jgi:predicted membrane protein
MKNNPHPRSATGQVVLGLLVIAMGLLFLLDNLGILDMHRAFSFWPMVFVIVGTVKLCDTQTQGGTLLGGGLVGIGVLLMLDRMDIIDFSWRTIWPLVLIGLGGFLVAKALRSRGVATGGFVKEGVAKDGVAMLDDAPVGEVIDVTAILGAYERRVTTQHFRGGEVTAVMGGCELDMRGASIQGEAVINVFAFWGGVTIKCPPDWSVILQGTPILGGFEEKTVAPPDNSKRLVIRGYAIMGGVEIRN